MDEKLSTVYSHPLGRPDTFGIQRDPSGVRVGMHGESCQRRPVKRLRGKDMVVHPSRLRVGLTRIDGNLQGRKSAWVGTRYLSLRHRQKEWLIDLELAPHEPNLPLVC